MMTSTSIASVADAPPGQGSLYFLAWQVIVCVAVCGVVTGGGVRLLPFFKHLDPLVSVGLYTLLPVLLYIGATALALSWETGRPATGVIHLTIVWPYIGYAACMLAGKYAVEGVRRWRRRQRRRRTRTHAASTARDDPP